MFFLYKLRWLCCFFFSYFGIIWFFLGLEFIYKFVVDFVFKDVYFGGGKFVGVDFFLEEKV